MDKNSVELKSFWFFNFHNKFVEYETRDAKEVLPTEKVREGLRQLGLQPILYDRLSNGVPHSGNSPLKPGQIVSAIMLLQRLNNGKSTFKSPVFMIAFRNYEKKLRTYQGILRDHCLMPDPNSKVESIFEVPIGGFFAVKCRFGNEFYRARVIAINLKKKVIDFWAVDEAFYGECDMSNLLYLNEFCATLEMLAVPAVFEQDPSPSQLLKFEDSGSSYCMAKVIQPKFSHDFGPRKIVLM